MRIIDRLKNNEFSVDELLKCLDSPNPIVLYETVTCIVNNHITDKIIIEKLLQLSEFLNDKDRMLGYYKLGHVAMGALLKLGFDEKVVFKDNLDNFEKETAIKFFQSAW